MSGTGNPVEISNALNSAVSAEAGPFCPRRGSTTGNLVDQLVTSFCSANQEEKDSAASALSPRAKAALRGYAWLCAEDAIKGDSGDLVSRGLVAMAIAHGPSDDPGDHLINVAILFRSAQKLGLNATAVFAAAADLTKPLLNEWIRSFPAHSPGKYDLEKGFQVHESLTETDFVTSTGTGQSREKYGKSSVAFIPCDRSDPARSGRPRRRCFRSRGLVLTGISGHQQFCLLSADKEVHPPICTPPS